jgi:hypothetical protein
MLVELGPGESWMLPVDTVVFPLPEALKTSVSFGVGTTPPLQFAPFDQFPSIVPSHVCVCPTAVAATAHTSSTAHTCRTHSAFFISNLLRLRLVFAPPEVFLTLCVLAAPSVAGQSVLSLHCSGATEIRNAYPTFEAKRAATKNYRPLAKKRRLRLPAGPEEILLKLGHHISYSEHIDRL